MNKRLYYLKARICKTLGRERSIIDTREIPFIILRKWREIDYPFPNYGYHFFAVGSGIFSNWWWMVAVMEND